MYFKVMKSNLYLIFEQQGLMYDYTSIVNALHELCFGKSMPTNNAVILQKIIIGRDIADIIEKNGGTLYKTSTSLYQYERACVHNEGDYSKVEDELNAYLVMKKLLK